tara:strand:+ start:42006 stop:42260 length:255 start_codon:yes stop_codon:yes gene_type:complete
MSNQQLAPSPQFTSRLQAIADELKPIVKLTESRIATTQYYYAEYGTLISRLSDGNPEYADIVALALIKAGANKQGVANGRKLFV